MLQFFEWLWNVIGIPEMLGLQEKVVEGVTVKETFQGFLNWLYSDLLQQGQQGAAAAVFCLLILLCTVVPYLLGSLNAAIIVSRVKYRDDIRTHGSGNAGLTNMGRVYGRQGALLTLLGDVLKQFVSVVVGIVVCGELGAYLAGTFCMLGHIFPVYYHFRGGKGVLTAATMVLMIDWQVFAVVFVVFAVTVLITRYVSLGSVIGGFALPGVVYTSAMLRGTVPSVSALLFALFIGCMLIYMHRSNIRRLFDGTENQISFRKKTK